VTSDNTTCNGDQSEMYEVKNNNLLHFVALNTRLIGSRVLFIINVIQIIFSSSRTFSFSFGFDQHYKIIIIHSKPSHILFKNYLSLILLLWIKYIRVKVKKKHTFPILFVSAQRFTIPINHFADTPFRSALSWGRRNFFFNWVLITAVTPKSWQTVAVKLCYRNW